MKRINILDSSVFNKIAAGEVVEKPASIIKEFVENSLDANSSEIFIEIVNGGIDKIKVVDNGTGIHPDDVKSAFLPHSTSKIKTVEDLSNILTLGFRGEALASIASVSKVSLSSKQKDFEIGKKITLEGGIVKEFEDVVLNNGTIVEVTDLFYNIPARKKFLRKSKTEESEITNLLTRYILANPHIKFNYVVDGKQVYKTNGTNLEDAIYLIYKQTVEENLIKVDYISEDIKINGFISKPTNTKSNRTYQTLIINGRYVVNNLISTSVQNAYGNYLMKGQFPMFVLNLTLPVNSLDVNVHPNKLDVKFENSQKIYGHFYSAVANALLNFSEIKTPESSIFVKKDNIILPKPNFIGKSFIEEKKVETKSFSENKKEEALKIYDEFMELSSSENKFCENPIMSKVLDKAFTPDEVNEVKIISNTENSFIEKYKETTTTQTEIFKNINELNYKIIGSCFDTYILIEMDDSLFVLDQHACHERLNYDKLINQLNNKTLNIQDLLIPFIYETNAMETDFILNNLETLKELGFNISLFGENCFKVSSVPSVLFNINLNQFFKEILSDLTSFKKVTTQDLLKEKISQKACKASVKAGDKLTNEEVVTLLNKMKEENVTLCCPHGRPCVIEFSKNFIEKTFKRKV